MSNKPPSLQQQVLFEEEPQLDLAKNTSTEQIVVADAEFELEQLDQFYQENNEIPLHTKGKPSWLFTGIWILASVLLGYELADFIITGLNQSPILTSIYAVLLALITLVVGGKLWREAKLLSQLKKTQSQQQQFEKSQLLDIEAVIAQCEQLTEQLAIDVTQDMEQQWQQVKQQNLQPPEIITGYQQIFLHQADQQAADIIAKYATEATVLVAMSPIALLDMLLLLWRNLHMMEQIAGQYGITLGYWSRIKLLRQLVMNLVYAGASELVADLGINLLNMELLGKFSTRLAQGFGAGMLTARLGIHTLKLCRPIPLAKGNKPWQGIHQRMIKQIKQLILKEK